MDDILTLVVVEVMVHCICKLIDNLADGNGHDE